jgi:peptidyl-prolyl cis-trans isomerase C
MASFRHLLCAVLLAFAAGGALAQPQTGSTVLIANSYTTVTRAEYDAELLRLPPDLREGFANTARRVNDLLVRMLVQKSLAAQARAAKVDTQGANATRIALETDKILAQLMIESAEATAAAEFDANRAKFETRARELYLVDRNKFETPEQISATHILFETKNRSPDEAKKLALEARAKIVAGADMGKLAQEVSEDPSAKSNSGSLGWFGRKEMAPAFTDAAFALKKTGDLSEPVLTEFGWHVIRLDGRRPATVQTFEQAHDAVLAELRRRYIDEKRDDLVAAVRRDPKTQINRAAVDALTPQIDPEMLKRATTPAASAPAAPK